VVPHSLWLPQVLGRRLEWWEEVHVLSFDPQELPAGSKNRRAWTVAHNLLGELGGRLDNVLTIVEHKQELSLSN
jgi:hypothetical protein